MCLRVSRHIYFNPQRHIQGFSVSSFIHASASTGVCSVESLSIFDAQQSKQWPFRLIMISILMLGSSASPPGNQTNWWWCGPAGVAGNPPRFVPKQNPRMEPKTLPGFCCRRLYFILCPTVPQLAAWHQKPLQRSGGLAGAREHRDHRHTF